MAPAGEAGEVWRADAIARQAADLGRPEQGRTADGHARLVLPLTSPGRAAGYLELTAPLRRRFRESEVELASLLAGQTVAAMERARAFRALQNRSATDTLTGLYSRWYFYERLYAEVARSGRYRQPLTLVLGELDGEEELARKRGPEFRDAVLIALARLLQTSLRDKVDIACRLGGGRFALLLPNTLPGPDAAGLVAERIRARVAATRLSNDEVGELGRFTMSLGVAGFPDAAEDADELAGVAGKRLAAASGAGGDRVEPRSPSLKKRTRSAPRRRTSRPDGREADRRRAGRKGPARRRRSSAARRRSRGRPGGLSAGRECGERVEHGRVAAQHLGGGALDARRGGGDEVLRRQQAARVGLRRA